MPDMRDLLRPLTEALAGGRDVLLCQVVETRGSTPQKAGALMLVDPDGGQLGTLGGGCVEAEVKQQAIRRLGQPGAELFTFVLDHDYAWADGLICGGKMVILAESLRGPRAAAYYKAYQSLLEAGLGFTEAIVLDPERYGGEVGARALFDAAGLPVAAWPVLDPSDELYQRIEPLEDRPKPSSRGGVAVLPTLPRVRLIVVGAGHVGQAVATLAAQADFDVWVVDDRREYAHAGRFPTAQRILVGPIDDVLPALEITPHTYALIVTRGHGHDPRSPPTPMP
jgi:xanthine dehydrogenase accessory factor